MSSSRSIAVSVIAMIVAIIAGTVGFMFSEQLTFFDALWLTVVTILTVGYGDTVPQTFYGKMFALIIIPVGISIVTYATGAVVSMMMEGEFSKTVRRRKMKKKIETMTHHIIVCGFGRVGEQVVRELVKNGTRVVVIERNADWLEEMGDPIPYVEGDATEDDVLIAAGIDRAAGLVAALPSDADNVFISLTAKGLNPNIQVVARAERTESEEKLRRAGADKVINPAFLSGRRMAMTMLKPVSVDYVDTIFHDRAEQYAIEEITIESHSSFVGTSVRDQAVRARFGVTIIAIQRQNNMIGNPTPDERFCVGDILIVFGEKRALEAFEQGVNKK
ncbi:potassium channel protein [Anoxybacillus sp. LAT_35]|uniref:potassium channel family protein n=1 Tax=Anoxybacillus TaxID=150247 RepID=UPI001EDA227A|nr:MULTISPECIES: potassium channel protein [Anoxybacillus]MCG5024837.1 potassium channel protein [Anoxybacillus flavithermus]MCG6198926.1 potassium channel protein [Anoxybacillus sp. LAT_38]MCG3084902.1 potassium channel protein [Anoxybacillus sp. LAT27]MCG6172584.1 potassium channel protein [Anoxybacillus sp. LAT_11]MCG6173146.1 potassium channel protein [Anoxybacillus sp. LAT_11]